MYGMQCYLVARSSFLQLSVAPLPIEIAEYWPRRPRCGSGLQLLAAASAAPDVCLVLLWSSAAFAGRLRQHLALPVIFCELSLPVLKTSFCISSCRCLSSCQCFAC